MDTFWILEREDPDSARTVFDARTRRLGVAQVTETEDGLYACTEAGHWVELLGFRFETTVSLY